MRKVIIGLAIFFAATVAAVGALATPHQSPSPAVQPPEFSPATSTAPSPFLLSSRSPAPSSTDPTVVATYAGPLPQVTTVQQLTPRSSFISPTWCPAAPTALLAFVGQDGTYLLNTNSSSSPRRISSVHAGYGFFFTSDCRTLAFRSISAVGSSVETMDLRSGKVTTLATGTDLSLPQRLGPGVIGYLEDGGLNTSRISADAGGTEPFAYEQNDNIFVTIDGRSQQITKNDGNYFLPKLSPDGSKILYQEISRGLYVYSLATTNTVALGPGGDASWSPDGKYVVFEREVDDGHAILSSSLYVADLRGNVGRLTDAPGRIDMNPSWSPDGRYLAFDSNGAIYLAAIR